MNTGNLQHFLRKRLEITSEGTSANHLTLAPQDFGSSVRGAAASKGTPFAICCNLLAKMALGASDNSTLMVSKLSRGGLACRPDGSKISQPLGETDRFSAAVCGAIIFPHPFSKQNFAGLKKKCNLRLGILPSPEPGFFFLLKCVTYATPMNLLVTDGCAKAAFLRITSHSLKQPLTLENEPICDHVGCKKPH